MDDHPDFVPSCMVVNESADADAQRNELVFTRLVRQTVVDLRRCSRAHQNFLLMYCFEVQLAVPRARLLPARMQLAQSVLQRRLCASTHAGGLSTWAQPSPPPQSERRVWMRHDPYAGKLLSHPHAATRLAETTPLNRTPSQQWLMHDAQVAGLSQTVARHAFDAFQAHCADVLRGNEASGELAFSVSIDLLHAVVAYCYPQSLMHYVGSGSPSAWRTYVQDNVGLDLIAGFDDGEASSRESVRCCLGAWPWPRARADCAESVAPASSCADAATLTTHSAFVSTLVTLPISAADAADDLAAIAEHDGMLRCVLNRYYLQPDVLVRHANELMAWVISEEHFQPHGVSSPPRHVHLLVDVLTGVEATPAAGQESGHPLASRTWCDGVATDLASWLMERHDMYRHVGHPTLTERLCESIRAAVHREDELPAEYRFCYLWCGSFRDFVHAHVSQCPGLSSFL